jgi:L-ascorbate metabolism protein UlaG (beta-lactamase superfamily)
MKKRIILIAIFLIIPQFIFSQIMTVHSNNGQLQQFQLSAIDSITFGSTVGTMKWLGHASIKIKTNAGIVIYIDPFAGTDYSEPADLILVTHGHSDHNQINKVTKKADCQIFSGMGANVGGTKMAAGDSAEARGIKIKAVEAYNSNHPKGTGVGFVIEIDSVKIYHCGDTSKIPEMAQLESIHLDYALLCIDGVYNMGPVEAMEVAEIIKARRFIPIHVAPSNATEEQKQQNIDKFNPPNKLIMKEGDTIYL